MFPLLGKYVFTDKKKIFIATNIWFRQWEDWCSLLENVINVIIYVSASTDITVFMTEIIIVYTSGKMNSLSSVGVMLCLY